MAAVIIAFGHSLLSMSGFETLAQVYREIAYPKLKNQTDGESGMYVCRDLYGYGHFVRGLYHS